MLLRSGQAQKMVSPNKRSIDATIVGTRSSRHKPKCHADTAKLHVRGVVNKIFLIMLSRCGQAQGHEHQSVTTCAVWPYVLSCFVFCLHFFASASSKPGRGQGSAHGQLQAPTMPQGRNARLSQRVPFPASISQQVGEHRNLKADVVRLSFGALRFRG